MYKIYFILLAFHSFLFANAQPAVKDEPRHHNVFENEYIRILDVFLPPNDTTQYHIHSTPSVFTTFTKRPQHHNRSEGNQLKIFLKPGIPGTIAWLHHAFTGFGMKTASGFM